MKTFETFPAPDPKPDAELASARVVGQDEMLTAIRTPLVTEILHANERQEAALLGVVRDAVNHAVDRVNAQQAALERVIDPLTVRLGTLVGTNDANLMSIVGRLGPEERAAISEPDDDVIGRLSVDGSQPGDPPSGFTTVNPDGSVVTPGGVALSPAELASGTITHTVDGGPAPTVPFTPGAYTSDTPTPSEPSGSFATFAPFPTPSPAVSATPTGSTTTPIKPPTTGGCPPVTVKVDACCPKEEEPEPIIRRAMPIPIVVPRPAGVVKPWNTTAKDLCATAEQYTKAFAALGDQIHTFLVAGFKAGADLSGRVGELRDLRIIGPVLGFMSEPAKVFEKVFKELDNVFTKFLETFGGPKAKALIGLYFTRGLMRSLGNAHIGWNFILTADISLEVVPEQMIQICDYLINYLYPVKIPELQEVELLYVTSEITLEEAKCLAAMHSRQGDEFIRNLRAKQTRLTTQEEGAHWLRWREPEHVLYQRFQKLGFNDPEYFNRFRENLQLLPPPSDAIRFALRDVFDPNKLGLQEMKDELAQMPGLREMLAAVGIEKTKIRTAEGKVMELDVPLLYHLSSYEECSPTQVYEMMFRFRPNRIARYKLPKQGGGFEFPKVITIETVQKLLKEKDYNPIWRKELAGIAFRLPGRIDIRNMYRRGVFGPPRGQRGMNQANIANPVPLGVAETELRERYMDLGFNEIDANVETLLDTIEFDRVDGAARRKKTMTRVCAAYKVGGFTMEQATQQLQNAGMTLADARDFIQGCDLDLRITDLRLAVSGVKKQWLDGAVSEQQARNLLRGFGVAQSRIDTLLPTWALYRTNKRRELAAKEIATYWQEGLINLADARARLANLGYDPTTINVILNHARLGAVAKSDKERERVAKALAAEARRMETERRSALREFEREEERELKKLLALQSEKNLLAWWKAGQIGESEVRAALAAKTTNTADIERWIATNRPDEE